MDGVLFCFVCGNCYIAVSGFNTLSRFVIAFLPRSKCLLISWPRQQIKKQRHHFADRGPSSQSYGFSSSHARMWEVAQKEGLEPNNCCFQSVILEKTLESPLDCKEITPVNPKGSQPPEYSLEGLMLKLQYFGHLMRRANSLEKTLMLGKIVGRRRRGWQRWLDGITLGDGKGQGSLACCSPWGRKELDTTERLKNNNKRCVATLGAKVLLF